MLKSLYERRRIYHLNLMYRLSNESVLLQEDRPDIVLCSRNNIKFKLPTTKLTKVMKSPFYRGVKLWDMLPEAVQRATTKVKFKNMI